MKRVKRILLAVGFTGLLLLSWCIAITAQTDEEKQAELIQQANSYLADEVYIRAVPLLEEATAYSTEHTQQAEGLLKNSYLKLIDKDGFLKKYRSLLERQMARTEPDPNVFLEAANHYFVYAKEQEAYAVLRDGIEKTRDQSLIDLYEDTRYAYKLRRTVYQDVTSPYAGTIGVKQQDRWGIASMDSSLLIPCEYDAVSTYDTDRAIVRKNNTVTAVDIDNNRLALLHEHASEIGNYAANRVTLKVGSGWYLATGELFRGSVCFDELGMFSEGYAAAKMNGKWGVVDSSGSEWVIPPEYDGIICDELDRCYSGGAVFLVNAGNVFLWVNGEQVEGYFEDAKPFIDGWAAVKKNGKWGFIDKTGVMKIEPQFEEALSFSAHLAAVKQGDGWGYISFSGEIVIEPVFLEVRSFYQGTAPVKTEHGWQFITLLEYEEGMGL